MPPWKARGRGKRNRAIISREALFLRGGQRKNAGPPQRTCAGCGVKTDKSALVRLVVDAAGQAVWDVKKTRPGRGAYICPNEDCVRKALSKGRLNKRFKKPVILTRIAAEARPWRADRT